MKLVKSKYAAFDRKKMGIITQEELDAILQDAGVTPASPEDTRVAIAESPSGIFGRSKREIDLLLEEASRAAYPNGRFSNVVRPELIRKAIPYELKNFSPKPEQIHRSYK